MFPINDLLDAILLGGFLFGLVFSIVSFLLGFADLGFDSDHGGEADGFFDGLINVSSILAFITWFGGIGYLARNGGEWPVLGSLLAAALGGLAGAFVVGLFVSRVLRAEGQTLDARDFERVGVIARVSSSIRPGGVGEIVYEQGGSRKVASARSSITDAPIGRGTEVVILSVDRGTAVVEPFEDLLHAE